MCPNTNDKVILQRGFVRFCSPVRLEFLAHAFCACCGKCFHISAVAVGEALFSYSTRTKTVIRELYVTGDFLHDIEVCYKCHCYIAKAHMPQPQLSSACDSIQSMLMCLPLNCLLLFMFNIRLIGPYSLTLLCSRFTADLFK